MNEQSPEQSHAQAKNPGGPIGLVGTPKERPFINVIPERHERGNVHENMIGEEATLYQVHKERDRAVTAIPEILWRKEERKKAEKGEAAEATKEEKFRNVDEDTLNVRLLELYALSQEYALEPATLKAAKHSSEIGALAAISGEDDNDFFNNLKKVLSETQRTDSAELEADAEQILTQANATRRDALRLRILALMEDPAVRNRYLSERKLERDIRHNTDRGVRLGSVLELRGLKRQLAGEKRRIRVEEFLAREEEGGKRVKAAGLTPQALAHLDRGIAIAEKREEHVLSRLSSPERGLLVTASLLERKDELEDKGFVLSPSRERLIGEIAELTAQGYRVFLGGPTGTGKTSIALFALKEMTGGNYSWITWTGETSVRDLFGDKKLSTTPEGKIESGMTKGPLTSAVLGEKQGVLHEELTFGQTSVQMSMKTLWASRPGDQINLPGWNGTAFTKEDLIELATGNLKGKRHEREEMDPAVAREFKALEVPYMSAEETRDYLILPMLMDRSGVLPLSRKDVEIISAFCRAAELSQLAHLEAIPDDLKKGDLYKIIAPSGEDIALSNVFLDTGTLKDLFSGWRTSGKPLSDYLREGLSRFIDENPHFRENRVEQETMKRILLAYGLNMNDKTKFSESLESNGSNAKPYLRPSELGFLLPALPSDADEFEDTPGVKNSTTKETSQEGRDPKELLEKFFSTRSESKPYWYWTIDKNGVVHMGVDRAADDLIDRTESIEFEEPVIQERGMDTLLRELAGKRVISLRDASSGGWYLKPVELTPETPATAKKESREGEEGRDPKELLDEFFNNVVDRPSPSRRSSWFWLINKDGVVNMQWIDKLPSELIDRTESIKDLKPSFRQREGIDNLLQELAGKRVISLRDTSTGGWFLKPVEGAPSQESSLESEDPKIVLEKFFDVAEKMSTGVNRSDWPWFMDNAGVVYLKSSKSYEGLSADTEPIVLGGRYKEGRGLTDLLKKLEGKRVKLVQSTETSGWYLKPVEDRAEETVPTPEAEPEARDPKELLEEFIDEVKPDTSNWAWSLYENGVVDMQYTTVPAKYIQKIEVVTRVGTKKPGQGISNLLRELEGKRVISLRDSSSRKWFLKPVEGAPSQESSLEGEDPKVVLEKFFDVAEKSTVSMKRSNWPWIIDNEGIVYLKTQQPYEGLSADSAPVIYGDTLVDGRGLIPLLKELEGKRVKLVRDTNSGGWYLKPVEDSLVSPSSSQETAKQGRDIDGVLDDFSEFYKKINPSWSGKWVVNIDANGLVFMGGFLPPRTFIDKKEPIAQLPYMRSLDWRELRKELKGRRVVSILTPDRRWYLKPVEDRAEETVPTPEAEPEARDPKELLSAFTAEVGLSTSVASSAWSWSVYENGAVDMEYTSVPEKFIQKTEVVTRVGTKKPGQGISNLLRELAGKRVISLRDASSGGWYLKPVEGAPSQESSLEGEDPKIVLEKFFDVAEKKIPTGVNRSDWPWYMDNAGVVSLMKRGSYKGLSADTEPISLGDGKKEGRGLTNLLKELEGKQVKLVRDTNEGGWFLKPAGLTPETPATAKKESKEGEEGRDPEKFFSDLFTWMAEAYPRSNATPRTWVWVIDDKGTVDMQSQADWIPKEYLDNDESFERGSPATTGAGIENLLLKLDGKKIKSVRGSKGRWYLKILD